jgi:hypothetical protein
MEDDQPAGAARCLSSSLNRSNLPADAQGALGFVLVALALAGLYIFVSIIQEDGIGKD